MSDWTVTEITPDDPTVPRELARVAGPLAPLDADVFAAPLARPSFVDLVAGELEAIGPHQTVIDAKRLVLADHLLPTRIQSASARYLEPASAAQEATIEALGLADPTSLLEASAAKAEEAGRNKTDYDAPPPPIITPGDPGPPPAPTGPTQPPEHD